MARGLFIIFPGHGHINPTIGLVNELISKGDEIVYITADTFKDKIEQTGSKFKGFSGYHMQWKNSDLHRECLDLAFEEEGFFDYLVVDPFINPGTKLIEKFKIKKIILTITTFAISPEMAKFVYEFNQKRGSAELAKMLKNKFFADYEEVNKKYGVPIPKSMPEVMKGVDADLKLVFTSDYYQPFADSFDNKHKFVGPSIFDRNELIDFKIDNPQNKKLVYVSLGTVANKNLDFYKNCFEALGNAEDIKVIMSIGKANKISELGDIPNNFEVYNYVPQLDLLKQIDLFITHGGMNSTSEAFYNNLPLIVVPQMAEQPLVAKRIAELGAGINLIDNHEIEDIKNAVQTILSDDNYKANAAKIGESLRNSGGYKKAAELISDLVK